MNYTTTVAVFISASCSLAIAQPTHEVTENSIGMKFVRIEAGEFQMGSNIASDGSNGPAHRVRITRPFLMGQTEVTREQFEKIMGTTPWGGPKEEKENSTVAASHVSWDDAVEFCQKLTESERRARRLPNGRAYRLPTEAEWEYACRAGTNTWWSFGNDEQQISRHAWWRKPGLGGPRHYAHKVGQKLPSPWNLYDMHGNVSEWCADWYDDNYYKASPESDPKGPASAGLFRVFRGGNYGSLAVACRSCDRDRAPPTVRWAHIGFRVVCELK